MKIETFGHFAKAIDKIGFEPPSYFHGTDTNEFDLAIDEEKRLVFVPISEWEGLDFAYVFSEICETHNYHEMAGHIYKSILNAKKRSGLKFDTNSKETIFLRELIVEIVKGNKWDYLYNDEPFWSEK